MTEFTSEQVAALTAPLDGKVVRERAQAGRQLSYIEGWWAIAEANRIFGFDGWTRETVLLEQTSKDLLEIQGYGSKPNYQQWRVSYIAKVRIRVGDVVREGVGYGSGMGKPEALGDAIESAVKEAETDAMKRALMTFGNPFGLALYDKEQRNVTDGEPKQERGNGRHFDDIGAKDSWAEWAKGDASSDCAKWGKSALLEIASLSNSEDAAKWPKIAANAKRLAALHEHNVPRYDRIMIALEKREDELRTKEAA